MSSYNQRKKREALQRLSQKRSGNQDGAAQELKAMRRTLHQRSFTDHDVRRKVPRSSASRLERSEVQGSSSSPNVFCSRSTASSSAGLFGKPSTSSTTASMGLFGKVPASATPSADPSSSSSQPQPAGVLDLQTGVPSFGETHRGSGFGITSVDSSDHDSVSGVRTLFGKPIPAAEPSSTTSTAQETVPSSATFGGSEPNPHASHPVSETKALFGKPIAAPAALADEAKGQPLISGGLFGKLDKTDHAPWSRKADTKEKGFGSKRPLILMEEEEGGREKDLSDLETFGARKRTDRETDEESKKTVIRRKGLFGKALDGVQGKKKRRSEEQNEEAKRHRVSITDRQRTASPDEIKRITSIVCKDIPPGLNLRGLLVDIFQEYGEVVKVSCHPDSASAIIYFADHSSAWKAKRKVKYLKRGTPPVSIYWASQQSKGSTPEKVKPKTTNIAVRPAVRSEVTKERTSLSPSKRTLMRREELASSSSQPETSRKTSASLGALEGRICQTASDRWEIMEERDRLIREERSAKQGAVPVLRADCEDMCPERERYMRQFQRRLSIYEVENVGAREQKVCHSATVKEYSRSSADQELPLPSDLRPPPVLDMTMNYLMNNIMDKDLKEEGFSWGEWYNFLWDRLRSIRKDITQQQLCNTTAVDLLEKCTRFHIFCAHHLCEEDLGTFDPKINSENLTKCLQSLKHLYDDLTEKGVACQNEAEFRAYDVLLNLNQGDISRQVQTYHDGVRNSEAILFSVQCVSSISSQNYVKFFKLVKSASYLNGCIMHRYFTQVRNIALEIINKAFSTNRGSPYPLSEVMRLLAFETQEQTMEFCSAHGLNVLNGFVQLSRSEFFQPDYVIPLARSISIIEEKNRSLIGEVVNGGPLPPNLRHLPASSFDGKGRFNLNKIRSSENEPAKDRYDADDVGTDDAIGPLHKQIAPEVHVPNPELIMKTGIDVINEVIQEFALSVSKEILICATSDELAGEIIEETTGRMVLEVSEESLQEAKEDDVRRSEFERLQREKIAAERKRITDEISEEILSCTIEEVLQSEISVLVSTEKRLYEEDQRAEQLDRIARDLSQDYLEAGVTTFSEQISQEVFEEELRIRDEALAEIERMVHQLQKARFLKIWRKIFAKKLRLKDTIETFPAGPAMNGTADQLKEFSSLGKSNRGLSDISSAQRIYDRQHDIANAIMQHHRSQYLSSKALWSPFDLPDLIGQHLIDVQGELDHVFWKLMVSLPSSSRSDEFALFSSWFKSKLRRGYIPEQMRRSNLDEGLEVETCSLYSSKCNEGGKVISICTKVISGTPPSSTGNHLTDKLIRETLLGTQGIVLVLDNQGCNHGDHKSYWEDQRKRLFRLLNSKPKNPGIPLLVYSIGEDLPSTWHAQCQSSLKVASLQAEGYVSEVHLSTFSGNLQQADMVARITSDLKWLASNCPEVPSLESASITEYLDVGLTNFFSLPIRENEKERRKAKIREESFDTLVSLYNDVIQHLVYCSAGSQLKTLSWPPPEFRNYELPQAEWNDPSTLSDLGQLLSSLRLPRMGEIDSDSWEDTKHWCLLYVKSLPGSPNEKVALISRVQWLLERCQREFDAVCEDHFQVPGCTPSPDVLPWTNLAEACVDYMVTLLKARIEEKEDGDVTRGRMVYYFQTDFDSFRAPWVWLQSVSNALGESVTRPDSINESYLMSVEERKNEVNIETEKQERESLYDISDIEEKSFADLPENIMRDKEMNISQKRLKNLLFSEKEESHRFDEYLKRALQDSPPLRLSSSIGHEGSRHPSNRSLDEDFLLRDGIERLEGELEASRRASRIEELRLKTLLSL